MTGLFKSNHETTDSPVFQGHTKRTTTLMVRWEAKILGLTYTEVTTLTMPHVLIKRIFLKHLIKMKFS